MLLLFGRNKELGRTICGVLLLAAGIVAHLAVLTVAGAVLVGWGALRLLAAWRSR
jgi:hypothetical protein